MAISLTVSATAQTETQFTSTATAATGLKPGKRTFSLTGLLGTVIQKGDAVELWGSNDGGSTFQPLRQNGAPVQMSYGYPEVVIDDASDHYGTRRVSVGSGSTLSAVGLNGETVTYTNGAWLVGGNNLGGAVGVLGTLDASPFQIKAEGVDIFDSDGSTTVLGNTEVAVPGNSLQLAAGAGGGQFAVTGAGTLDLQTASGALSVNTTGGAINIGTGTNAKNITVGNVTGATTVALLAGTGGIGMGATGAGGVQIVAGASASVTMEGGSGGINIGANAVAQAITIGNATGATSVAVNGGTGAMSFGANAVAHTVTIGSVTGAAATSIRAGTGGLAIVNNGATWSWPTAIGGAGTKLTDAAGNGVLSFA